VKHEGALCVKGILSAETQRPQSTQRFLAASVNDRASFPKLVTDCALSLLYTAPHAV